MRDLHEELTALSVEWPATPDIAAAVAARLAPGGDAAAAPDSAGDGAVRARRGRRVSRGGGIRPAWRPALAYGLAVLVAGFAAVMAASPDARSAVLEWLGLKSVKVERREPVAPPPRPGTLGSGLGLGTPVTLGEARERSPFVSLPTAPGLGRPDAVYLGGDSVALVYGERPGFTRAAGTGADLLVQEFRARVEPFIEKTVGAASSLEQLTVDGDPAFFITGAHGFAYQGRDDVRFEQQRLAGNTLLVERADGLLIRIEGDVARDRAVAIARSIP